MAALSPIGVPTSEALREFAKTYRPSGSSRGNPAGGTGGGCVVEVGAYTRTRNGKPEQVGGYRRSNPYCGDGGDDVLPATERTARGSASPERRPTAPTRAWEGQPNQSWREQPGSSALGRYQVLRDPLIDAGWRDPVTGAWTSRARAAGVASDAEFLGNPSAQEAAFNDVMRENERQLRANGSTRWIGQQVPGLRGVQVPITEAGLAAAAHREGARAVRRYLDHRAANLPPPAPIAGRGNLSRFNEIERRLRAFAGTPYQRVAP
jgi:hypothetical protein